MPPSSNPMITRTIAISTSVKPACVRFMAQLLRVGKRLRLRPLCAYSLQGAAEHVYVGAGLGVGRGIGSGTDRRVWSGRLLSANSSGSHQPVIHLRIHRDRNLVGQARRADDQPAEAAQHRVARAVPGLHTDNAGDRVEGLRWSVARDKP